MLLVMSKVKNIYFHSNEAVLTFRSGTRFPRSWPQPPRRCAPAGSSAQVIPAGVSSRRSKSTLIKAKKQHLLIGDFSMSFSHLELFYCLFEALYRFQYILYTFNPFTSSLPRKYRLLHRNSAALPRKTKNLPRNLLFTRLIHRKKSHY